MALVLVVWLVVREGTEPVTRERLGEARARWAAADISSYDMDLQFSGAQSGIYRVRVRGGRLKHITLNDGPANPSEEEYWTVEGLFRIIEEELDLAEDPSRGAFPAGTQVWLRMHCDPDLGYPVRFIRQVPGTNRGVQIRVLRLAPVHDPPQADLSARFK